MTGQNQLWSSIAYFYKNNLYLNITNNCTAKCTYCIKYLWDGKFRGYNLKLETNPTLKEVIESIETAFRVREPEEVIFCGYGEPLLRLDLIKEVAKYLKSKNKIVRINTNGHGNLIYKRNICPELQGLIDKISISLNAANRNEYFKLYQPEFGIETFDKVLEFVKECKKYIPEVIITTIAFPTENSVAEVEKIARKLKVKFVIRPYLTEYKDH